MEDNIYKTNVEMKPKRSFSRGFRFLLGLGIFLTGFMSLSAVCFVGWGISDRIWQEIGACQFGRMLVLYGCIVCCFVFLVKIEINKTIFSRLLVRCIRIIGGIVTAASVVLPRLSGYKDSGFTIMSYESFTLIDGWILMIGVLLLIFAGIIKEGFSMQNELDEVL